MKHFCMLLTFGMLLSSSLSLHASSQELQEAQLLEVQKEIVINPNVDHTMTKDDFNAILPHTHGLSVNATEPFYIEKQDLTLERLLKAQNEGWLAFHMTHGAALSFASAHWHLAIKFTWPRDAMGLLDDAYSSKACGKSTS